MRILVFNWKDIKHPYAGGAEVNIHEQAKIWIKQGHKVTQFSPRFKNCKNFEIVDGVNIMRKGGRYSLYLWSPIYYLLRLRKEVDVVIDIENGIPFFTPLYVRKPILGIMHHVHQDVFFKELFFLFAWIPYLMEKYMHLFYKNIKFIAVSNTTKTEMIKRLNFSKDQIEVVYNGLNNKFYSNAKKTKFQSILYFGRLMKYKRIDLLIDVFSNVLRHVPDAKLFIAGSGIVEDELKSKVRKINLSDKIIFYGFVSEKEKINLIKGSWIFANPSSMEGWGVTVIETNSLGVPAVVFDVPGLRESVKNNETGFVVNNADQMVNKIISLLTKKTLRNKFGKNAIQWSKNFSWDKTAENTLKILNDLTK